MEKRIVRVSVNRKETSAREGMSISELISLDRPCGGHGKCGKCKVKATGALSPLSKSEESLLTEEEKSAGIRLACSTLILGECEINTLDANTEKGTEVVTEGISPKYPLDPAFSRYGVAIDIGTTTLAAKLFDSKGDLLSQAGGMNPQSSFGADVISRIEACLAGKGDELARAIREALDLLLLRLAASAGLPASEIDALSITGNTTMLYLLTNTSPEPLSHAPFLADRLFGETLSPDSVGLSSLSADASVYLAPCVSAFVGADTVCAILATQMCDSEGTSLLADIGTNGEIALLCGKDLLVCSTAAGPAFEGGGISKGMRGSIGAIDRVELVNGELFCHVIGEGEAVGICGSGLVDAVACLLDSEAVDESGFIDDGEIRLSNNVILTQQDVRMLQLAKSAICAGMLTLADEGKISLANAEEVYIAGGFGHYLNIRNAVRIGLIPRELEGKIKIVGNAALSGASMLLLNKNARSEAIRIAREARTVELSVNKSFAERYMYGMMFE